MLRTGYFNGTPIEGGKIADSEPVDLFAGARQVADASSQQQQQQKRLPLGDEEGEKGGSDEPRVQARQGMGGGGRQLGRQGGRRRRPSRANHGRRGPARGGNGRRGSGADSGDHAFAAGDGEPEAPLTADVGTLISLLRQFQMHLEDTLLPLPDPKVVRRRLFNEAGSPPSRRSRPVATKGKGISMTAVKKTQRLLMRKLGLSREEERLSAKQLKEYAEIFASPLGPEQVVARSALFGLEFPTVGEDGLNAAGETQV
ncbi:unnamed protein product [Alopecurus aequalis]